MLATFAVSVLKIKKKCSAFILT